jgi:hypothetical protein
VSNTDANTTHCRERKGFLSEGKRFNDAETDNPGPGSYAGPQQNTLEYKHDSISKRGYGAMASRDKRFDRCGNASLFLAMIAGAATTPWISMTSFMLSPLQ